MMKEMTNKNVREEDIAKVIGDILGIQLEAHNTKELQDAVNEILPVLDADWMDEECLTAADFWGAVIGDPVCSYIIMTLEKKGAKQWEKLGYAKKFDFEYYDEDYEETYKSADDVPTEIVMLDIVEQNSMVLENILEFSKKYKEKIKIFFGNYLPIRTSEEIELIIENGQISGGGDININLGSEIELITFAMHFGYVIDHIAELDKYNINVKFTGELGEKHMKIDDSYLGQAIRAKYTGEELVHSEEEALEIVKKAPVVILYIAEQYRTKRVIFEFMKSNFEMLKNAQKQLENLYPDNKYFYTLSSIIRTEFRDVLINTIHDYFEYYNIDTLWSWEQYQNEPEFIKLREEQHRELLKKKYYFMPNWSDWFRTDEENDINDVYA